MALNKVALGQELEAGLRQTLALGAEPYPDLTKYCNMMADIIVTHIQANGELNNGKMAGGTFTGTVNSTTCEVVVANQTVTGGIR